MSQLIDTICPMCYNCQTVKLETYKKIKLECFCNMTIEIKPVEKKDNKIMRVIYTTPAQSKINKIEI